jgi:hypothetical protein
VSLASEFINCCNTACIYGTKESNGVLSIYFRPTYPNLDEWLNNLNFLVIPYSNMKRKFLVHRGFLKAYKSIRKDLWDTVEEFLVIHNKVRIYGYSRGGALATLAHEDLNYKFNADIKTITFGAPRVFSWFTPRDRFTGLTNYIVKTDLVTKVPPWWLGFTRVGNTEVMSLNQPGVIWSTRHHFPGVYVGQLERLEDN